MKRRKREREKEREGGREGGRCGSNGNEIKPEIDEREIHEKKSSNSKNKERTKQVVCRPSNRLYNNLRDIVATGLDSLHLFEKVIEW